MSDTQNPYQSPTVDLSTVQPEAVFEGLSYQAFIYLKQASPWIRFIGILQFILSGFTALLAIILPFSNVLASGMDLGGVDGGMLYLIAVFYLLTAVLICIPARFTYRFGAKLKHFILSGSSKDLETALQNNKSLWKFYGILLIISLALFPATLLFGIIFTVVSLV